MTERHPPTTVNQRHGSQVELARYVGSDSEGYPISYILTPGLRHAVLLPVSMCWVSVARGSSKGFRVWPLGLASPENIYPDTCI